MGILCSFWSKVPLPGGIGGHSGETGGHIYAGSNNIDTVAWYSDNSNSTTHEVGLKMANELGIYDMSGNVYEWCSDWYSSEYYGESPIQNPIGAISGSTRILRDGSWLNGAGSCRVADRDDGYPDGKGISYGFRVAFSF